MSHLPNPYIFTAVIRNENVLEDPHNSNSPVFTVQVLCSHSKARYELGEIIKRTIYGAVVHGVILEPVQGEEGLYQRTETDVAIKVYGKHIIASHISRSREQPLNEMSILQYLGNHHPHILGQLECCADESNMYSIMPLVHGGELFDHIVDHGAMSEDEVRPMFYRLLLAVMRLHEMQIAHCDISLENIMFDAENQGTKLIDFGMALPLFHRQHDHNSRGVLDTLNDMCGKVNYMPPEVIRGEVRIDPFAADIWSTGIVLFYCLLGFPPMGRACADDQRYSLIMSGDLRALLQHWNVSLSDEVLSLITMILTESVAARPTLEQILRHPWLHKEHLQYHNHHSHRVHLLHGHSLESELKKEQFNVKRDEDNLCRISAGSTNNKGNRLLSSSNSAKMHLRSLSRKEAAGLQTPGTVMHATG